jgi:hypothetical protein
MTEREEEKGFVVKDRRIFSEDGDSKNNVAEESPKKNTAENENADPQTAEGEPLGDEKKNGEKKPGRAGEPPPQAREVDFSSFLFSLYTSAVLHFGDVEDPVTGKKEKNLAAAKQMIDIVSMLEEKTRGNLNSDEQGTIDALLYELRMRYVKES